MWSHDIHSWNSKVIFTHLGSFSLGIEWGRRWGQAPVCVCWLPGRRVSNWWRSFCWKEDCHGAKRNSCMYASSQLLFLFLPPSCLCLQLSFCVSNILLSLTVICCLCLLRVLNGLEFLSAGIPHFPCVFVCPWACGSKFKIALFVPIIQTIIVQWPTFTVHSQT